MAIHKKIDSGELTNTHIEIGTLINIKDLKNVETQTLFALYCVEEKFDIKELTSKQIFEFINNKLRLKTSLPSINIAIKRSGGKISSVKKNGLTYHKIMNPGIDEIKKILLEPSEKDRKSVV